SSLTSDNIELANIISQLRSKYKCDIHSTPCYVEDLRHHIQLTHTCLQLWSRDIKAKITTIETSPIYPTFRISYQKINQLKNEIEQLKNQNSGDSNLIPTLHEFLETLDKKYNSNRGYLILEPAFAQEEITVNIIKDLSDAEFIKLGVNKI
ncbi:3703_t:CDS:2, partial [Scutellospora calospora]